MTQREELDVTIVNGKLLNTGVFVKSLPEYLVVVGLYQIAGCKIWPWHEGYKEPNDGDDRSLYVYKDVGFFKEIYPVAVNIKILTITELFEIVIGNQAAKATPAMPQWIPVDERLPMDGEKVLIFDKFGTYGSIYTLVYYDEFMLKHKGVTHWMPLPTAPDGDK